MTSARVDYSAQFLREPVGIPNDNQREQSSGPCRPAEILRRPLMSSPTPLVGMSQCLWTSARGCEGTKYKTYCPFDDPRVSLATSEAKCRKYQVNSSVLIVLFPIK